METVAYGPGEDQQADLHLPAAARPAVVCLLHGGFWRLPHGRDQLDQVAHDLAGRGLAVWNIGYRRLGGRDTAWPAPMSDVAAALDHLASLPVDLDLARVAVVGHSAGGQLALWSARRFPSARPVVRPAVVVGLAPLADLRRAREAGLGHGAVAELIGEVPGRLAEASPAELLPLGVRQIVLHGTDDLAVPLEHSRAYCEAAARAGDRVELVELRGSGHMDFLDPRREAHSALVDRLAAVLGHV